MFKDAPFRPMLGLAVTLGISVVFLMAAAAPHYLAQMRRDTDMDGYLRATEWRDDWIRAALKTVVTGVFLVCLFAVLRHL